MALPIYQAIGTPASGSGSVSPAWPTHQADDIALLVIESGGGEPANLGTANGFVAVTDSPQATGAGETGTQLSVYWCRATSSSMAAPTVTDPGGHVYAVIITFRGCITTGDPWNAIAGSVKSGSSSTVTYPTVTTSVADCLIVLINTWSNDDAGPLGSGYTNAALANWRAYFRG